MVTGGDMGVQWMIKDSFFLQHGCFEKNVVTKVGEAWQGALESCKMIKEAAAVPTQQLHRPQHLRAEQPQKS